MIDKLSIENCHHGEVKLVGSNYNNTGTVAVCVNDQWVGVCENGLNNADGSVICRQLGYTAYGNCNIIVYSCGSVLQVLLYMIITIGILYQLV